MSPKSPMIVRCMKVGGIVLSLVLSSHAVTKTCTATTAATLQACIDTGATSVSSAKNDSLYVKYSGASKAKLTIRAKKNVWVIGDTVGAEVSRPSITWSDVAAKFDSSATYDLSGAVLVDSSRFVTLAGINIIGGAKIGGTAFEATYASGYKNWKGNNALSIRRSYGVRAVRCTFKNAWRGILIRGENLGGASAYPNPQDPDSLVRQNLPTSNAGLYGRHVIEKCRFYDNSWGVVGDRDWDIGSVFRFNEFFDNYVHAGDLGTDPWNQAGGAFFTDDVAITPYRIHNNTFYRNGVTFGAYYKAGTQHLFYDNLVGRPFRYYASGFNFSGNYTQTERQTDMLQYFAEHQRSNIIEPQDSSFTSGTVTQLTGSGPGTFRIFRQKMSRRWTIPGVTTDWRANQRAYDYWDDDTVSLTWYAQEGVNYSTALTSGGAVTRIRQNMWVESYRDPFDYSAVSTKGSAFAVPFIPKQISSFVKGGASSNVFRDVSSFDIWWTPSIPFTSPLLTGTSRTETFLQPLSTSAFTTNRIASKGWRNYSTWGGIAPDIGALGTSGGYALGTLPQLELQDTLVEDVSNDTIQFSLNTFGWNGLDPAKLKNLRVVDSLSKFYRTIPIADTFYNASDRGCSGNQCTQVNSILDSMPWPTAVKLTALPWVNDSLAKGLRSERYLYAGTFAGGPLDASTNYARAEVVLAGEYDGKTIYSNPGVFIYAKPKYNMAVNILEPDCKTALPLASDGVSRKVRAGDSVCLQVQPNLDTTFTQLNFKPLFSDYSSLMGSDTAKMQLFRSTGWDTVAPGYGYNFMDSGTVLDQKQTLNKAIQFRQSGTGRLTMRASFNMVDNQKIQDLRYIMGSSPRILVVPNTIYQATIDTMIYQSDTAIPNLAWKLNHTERPYTDSNNVVSIPKLGASVASVAIHLRDVFGNIVNDSDSLALARGRGLQIKVSTPSRMLLFAPDSTKKGRHDSTYAIDSARLILSGLYPYGSVGTYQPLVSEIVRTKVSTDPTDTASFVNDTGWVKVTGMVDTLRPKDAVIIDHDGDGNGDTVYIWLSTPLASYPASFLLRWGAPAETLTVTDSMLIAWGVKSAADSGTGDTLLAIPLPSSFNLAKGTYPKATWIHEQTSGPADTGYFPAGVTVHIRDGIGPVATSALLTFGSSYDTLQVSVSEDIVDTVDGASLFLNLNKILPPGAKILSITGKQAKIIIPSASNPLVAGDSLRLNPKDSGGTAFDTLANGVGEANPWVILIAGIRPPMNGWFLDTNGDGRVETALLRFVQNPHGTCPGYTFFWPSTDSLRSTSAGSCRLDPVSKDSLYWRVSFTPFTFGATGSSLARSQPLGRQDASSGDATSYRFFMYDSVGPVLLDSSYLNTNVNTALNPDTLRIVPSEAIMPARVGTSTAKLIVQFKRGTQVIADPQTTIQALNCSSVSSCRLVVAIGSAFRPTVGDSVRLSVEDSVTDTTVSLNAPSINNPFQPIHGKPRAPYVAAYFDRNGDGAIDSVVLVFSGAPTVGSVIVLGNPTGDSGSRTYTVTASDSGKTTLSFNIAPWGENVTSVSSSTTAYIIDPTGRDSTSFKLADSTAAVISKATISYSSDRTGNTPDTVKITASELVKFDSTQGISFYYKPAGQDTLIAVTYDIVSLTFDSTTMTWTILVKPLGGSHPVDGDSIRFASTSAVTDLSGNSAGTIAKFTDVVELTPRILDPVVTVETPITKPSGPSSAPFQLLVSSQGTSTSKWTPMNSKTFVGNSQDPTQGHAVISFSSNMPSKMHIYIYDHLGVYVNDFALNITADFLASAPKNRLGEVTLGLAWDGTSASGMLVTDGIYMIRLVTQRDLSTYETSTLGKHISEIENHVVKVGIAR